MKLEKVDLKRCLDWINAEAAADACRKSRCHTNIEGLHTDFALWQQRGLQPARATENLKKKM